MSGDRDLRLEASLADARAAIASMRDEALGHIRPGADAASVTADVEALLRQVHALGLDVQAEIDERGLYAADGHASAKVLARHAGQLSCAEASRRAKCVRALRDLPVVAAAHRAGRVGIDQVNRIARVHANPRIRDLVLAHDGVFVELAEQLSYPDLDAVLTDWERLADEDGAGDRARRSHDQRDARIIGHYDGTFAIRGSCGGLQGVEMREIHQRYVAAEFEADWAEARARLGESATANDLSRSDPQRHLDALHRLMLDAAGSLAVAAGGSMVETNVLIDQDTFEREAARIAGADPGPDPRAETHLPDAARASQGEPGRASDQAGTVGYRCGTIDGQPLHPTEVVARALVGHIRRVVLGADSVTIDLGRRSRLFTGPAALAARLGNTTCHWAACLVAASRCQIDHLTPWGPPGCGSTCPDNGGPACGTHNRLKEHGFRVWRDPAGNWHTYRPDGTEI